MSEQPAMPAPPVPAWATAYAERAHGYARRVVAGDVVAGKWIRLACQRHLRDLEKAAAADAAGGDGYPYRFDALAGARVCRFGEMLPHVKGEWARVRANGSKPRIVLEDW